MQRRASTVLSATMAPVGQASMQAVHEPQLSRRASGVTGSGGAVPGRGRAAVGVARRPGGGGTSGGRGNSSSSSARNSHEPARQWISMALRPTQPNPARAANSRSGRGPVSTNARCCTGRPARCSRAAASRASLACSTSW